jgi:hypothetical protein
VNPRVFCGKDFVSTTETMEEASILFEVAAVRRAGAFNLDPRRPSLPVYHLPEEIFMIKESMK